MKISKTAFKEYAKCDRIYPLENIYLKKVNSDISFFDQEGLIEILGNMFDKYTGDDLIKTDEEDLKDMLEYYDEVERYALLIASNKFGQKIEYFKETKKQKSFSFKDESGHEFYCYLDGFLETDDNIIIIEVKATTSKKFESAGSKKNPLFLNNNNILNLNLKAENDKTFINHYKKLFNIHSDTGKYVFDLAVERYIIEETLKRTKPEKLNKKFKYYLAVLNSDYVFDGKYKNGIPIYTDDLIKFIDLSEVTYEYLSVIKKYKNEIINTISDASLPKEIYGQKCGYKTNSECIFIDICFPHLKKKGSVTEFIETRTFGPEKLSKIDLINQGITTFNDIDSSWLSNPNNKIQLTSYIKNKEYINSSKIKSGIDKLVYPIYHLDFESFPCPLPRYRGEKPYSQSLFQFSIHIENEPGKCNIIDDNEYYLVNDYLDRREELVENLIKSIDLSNGGTVLVYNKNFEYSRINELIKMFPKYSKELELINDSMFDLLDIIKTNKDLYINLGFNEEESKIINYYHADLKGSYSIKSVLPLFSHLSYDNLNVKNGMEAMHSYIKFKHLDQEEIALIRQDLIDYCRQDTWAMVVILDKLRKLINKKG